MEQTAGETLCWLRELIEAFPADPVPFTTSLGGEGSSRARLPAYSPNQAFTSLEKQGALPCCSSHLPSRTNQEGSSHSYENFPLRGGINLQDLSPTVGRFPSGETEWMTIAFTGRVVILTLIIVMPVHSHYYLSLFIPVVPKTHYSYFRISALLPEKHYTKY